MQFLFLEDQLIGKKHNFMLPKDHYSHLSNKRKGWNKHGGGTKIAKLINVEVGINVEVRIFLKNQ